MCYNGSMTYSLTRAGYLTKESIDTLDASDDLSEVKTEALLRAAVEKIDLVKIPHVIDENSWVAEYNSAPVIMSPYGYSRPIHNIYKALDALFGKPMVLFGEESVLASRLSMFRYYLTLKNVDVPDAKVNGNLVFWHEHAFHIALWSPRMATLVSAVLTAEYKALKGGKTPDSTTLELRNLAEGLLLKAVGSETETCEKSPVFTSKFKYLKKDFLDTLAEHKKYGYRKRTEKKWIKVDD